MENGDEVMGTKNKPGDFDCYANAKPDEPTFTLLGRDPMAGVLVRMWAWLRQEAGEDPALIEEAVRCAASMDLYAAGIGKTDQIKAVVESLKRITMPW